jgi:cytochrome c oxidase cbb3-type subunit I/II
MSDPRAVSPGSNIPPYAGMTRSTLDFAHTEDKLRAMRAVGVPYNEKDIAGAVDDARAQGKAIVADLKTAGVDVPADAEIVALIAYLQRLGAAAPAGATPPTTVSMAK